MDLLKFPESLSRDRFSRRRPDTTDLIDFNRWSLPTRNYQFCSEH